MKRKRSQAVDYVVYLAVRLVVCVAQTLSIRQSYALADWLAAVAFRVDKRHRLIALENLTHAFGDQYNPRERDALVRGVYRHFCRMAIEMLHIPRKLHITTWRRRITLSGHRMAIERMLRGGPLLMLTGHFGNWEMAGYLFGVFGFTPHAIARTLDNPFLDRFIARFRERTGQRLIPKKGGYDQMLQVMKAGGTLAFIADQDAGPRGLFVDFFGRPASTHKAIALLAIEYNAALLVGGAWRSGDDFHYVVHTEDVIEPADWADQSDPVRYITERYTAGLERMIRHAPEQYLWLHRRWKHEPKHRGTGPGTRTQAPHAAVPTVSSSSPQ